MNMVRAKQRKGGPNVRRYKQLEIKVGRAG